MPTEVTDFHGWAIQHARIFGFPDYGLTMLLSWERLSVLAGWTPRELAEATDWLAMRAPPDKIDHHLPAIRNRIDLQRAHFRPSADNPSVPDLGMCELCSSTGRAIVPHPDYVRAATWLPTDRGYYPTAAVLCKCPLGRWFAGRQSRDAKPMDLKTYEAINPLWDEQIQTRQAEQREAARLEAQTEGTLKAALAQRIGQLAELAE